MATKSKTKSKYLSPLMLEYNRSLLDGRLIEDPAQRAVIERLDVLLEQLEEVSLPSPSAISNFFNRKKTSKRARSLYIWGNVGRGKSMLMDMFFNNIPFEMKRRVHFHAFMQEVHARIHELRKRNAGDPVVMLARDIASETRLLCFDELQANDVADASLLHRLFAQLFDLGVIVVSTSNHPPLSLYTGGIQRERFGKFIALLEEKMTVITLSSPIDYRYQQIRGLEKRFAYPLGPDAEAFIHEVVDRLSAGIPAKQGVLTVQGRALEYVKYSDAIGRFTFAQLCEAPLGAADYLALAQACDTVILENIPALPPEKRNEAKRFVNLIDALYEHKVKLLATCEVAPEAIYPNGDGSFEFARTVSRLAEMQSAGWGE